MGAVFGLNYGWEHPLWFSAEGEPREETIGFDRQNWWGPVGREARMLRDRAGIIDISNNLGDAKSLMTHPASTTHRNIGAEARVLMGITDGMLLAAAEAVAFRCAAHSFLEAKRRSYASLKATSTTVPVCQREGAWFTWWCGR